MVSMSLGQHGGLAICRRTMAGDDRFVDYDQVNISYVDHTFQIEIRTMVKTDIGMLHKVFIKLIQVLVKYINSR